MTIRVVSTGGTIASTADDVETEEFANVPSPHLTIDPFDRP